MISYLDSQNGGTPGGVLINSPAGTSATSILIAQIIIYDNVAATLTATGWNVVATHATTEPIGGKNAVINTLWRVNGAGAASYIFLSSDGTSWTTGCVAAYDGVDNTTPIDPSVAFALGNGPSAGTAGVSPSAAGLALFAANAYSTNITADPSGYTNRQAFDGGGTRQRLSDLPVSAGATGAITAAGPSFDSWWATSFVLLPVSAGGSTPVYAVRKRYDEIADEDPQRRLRALIQAQQVARSVLAPQRRPTEWLIEEDRARRKARIVASVTAWPLKAKQRRNADEFATDEVRARQASAALASSPIITLQILSQQKRASDFDALEESRKITTAPFQAPAPVQGTQLSAQKRALESDVAEDRTLAHPSAFAAPVAPVLAVPKRVQESDIAEEHNVPRTGVFAAPVAAVWQALLKPRRGTDEAQEDRAGNRPGVFAAAPQRSMLGRPRVASEESTAEERAPRIRGAVAKVAAVVQAFQLASTRKGVDEVVEERHVRSAATFQSPAAVRAPLASPRRATDEVPGEELRTRRGFIVQAAQSSAWRALLPQRRIAEDAPDESASPRRGYVAQVLTQVLLYRTRFVQDETQDEAPQRRSVFSTLAAFIARVLGGTVTVSRKAQSVQVAPTLTQSVRATQARVQSVTVTGVKSMYYVNTRIRMTFNFYDFDGTLADPDAVSLLLDGTTVQPLRLSSGVWYYDYLPTVVGPKQYVISGTGVIAATRGGVINILADLSC